MLQDAAATETAGAILANALPRADGEALRIFLCGELGAGKTTFTRGFLRGLGYAGRVPSPTYTLVEPYEVAGRQVWHLDLYRLGDGAELEYLGLDEMGGAGSVLLIEWPERGAGYLPSEDLSLVLKVISNGRSLSMSARTPPGEVLMEAFKSRID
jgi:tRNA threonylcarbamoyladenosine biosynthesis protein TsaE